MITKRLGMTELQVSVLGCGASPLGGAFGPTDKTEGARTVHAAIDQGINYFDVAPLYGDTLAEVRLGEALAGKRHKVILATKCGHYREEAPFDFSAERVRSSLEGSLLRLQTDYVDLYQAHDMDRGDPRQIIEETLPAMRRLQDEGKVRYVGITGFRLDGLLEVAQGAVVDTVLSFCHYDLVNQTLADELAPFCQANDIGLISASPLHMRLLTALGPPEWNRRDWARLEGLLPQAIGLCVAHGTDISELAMQFALQNPYAATTLVGMSKRRHLERNLAAVENPPDPELLAQVIAMLAGTTEEA